jgi:hypothetical protein
MEWMRILTLERRDLKTERLMRMTRPGLDMLKNRLMVMERLCPQTPRLMFMVWLGLETPRLMCMSGPDILIKNSTCEWE